MPVVPERRQHILRPVRLSTIVVSFAVALLLNFLPWHNVAFVPDFVALTQKLREMIVHAQPPKGGPQ